MHCCQSFLAFGKILEVGAKKNAGHKNLLANKQIFARAVLSTFRKTYPTPDDWVFLLQEKWA